LPNARSGLQTIFSTTVYFAQQRMRKERTTNAFYIFHLATLCWLLAPAVVASSVAAIASSSQL
jgi:hypothetical protein